MVFESWERRFQYQLIVVLLVICYWWLLLQRVCH